MAAKINIYLSVLMVTLFLYGVTNNDITGAFLEPGDDSEVSRSFSGDIYIGQDLTVNIQVIIDHTHSVYIIEEDVPNGLDIVDSGGASVSNRTLRWSFAQENAAATRTITYTIRPSTNGTFLFAGFYYIDGMENTEYIKGSNSVIVGDCIPSTETCDGFDNDCDGDIDEGLTTRFFRDKDGDSFGDYNYYTYSCTVPIGFTTNDQDCNDNYAFINPNQAEVCDQKDNDCDGKIDEDAKTVFYRDQDSDGYGTPDNTKLLCEAQAGYAASSTDCNDIDRDINPGETEVCDGKDNDCNNETDEDFSDETCRHVCQANDFYWTGGVGDLACCGNNDLEDSPYAIEARASDKIYCDGRDNDCDGTIDEFFGADDCEYSCLQNNGQDYNRDRVTGLRCCGDNEGEGYPFEETEESCDDGNDNDCDGKTDGLDPNCAQCISDFDCDDGVWCNGVERCEGGTCIKESIGFDDGINCTIDSCDEENRQVFHVLDDSLCLNGLWCDGDEYCDKNLGCRVAPDQDCDDSHECSIDTCEEGTDTGDNQGICKNDVDDCGCLTGEDCDDGNDCTDDICSGGKCINRNDDRNNCDDGFWCTLYDRCHGGKCIALDREVDDGVPCTIDSCDEKSKSIKHNPDDGGCQDGLFCNGNERCEADGCKPSSKDIKDDGVDCTIDVCDEKNDLVTNTVDDSFCDNGLWCDGDEYCDKLNDCQVTAKPECVDGKSCSEDTCSEGISKSDGVGECVFDTDGCECLTDDYCDDDNDCTDDKCDDGVCTNVPDDLNTCDDGYFCTINDRCQQGECVTNPRDFDDNVGCTHDSCDDDIDEIVHVKDDNKCDDGLFCNGAEICESTGCVKGIVPGKEDNVECKIDECNEDTDTLSYTLDDSVCLNGLWCDGTEYCSVTGCMQRSAQVCSDGLECSEDLCSEGSNLDDNAGDCLAVLSDCDCTDDSECDDGNDCTDDVCENNMCKATPNNFNTCDDGFWCTINDRCEDGICINEDRPYDDGISCTSDSCDEINDVIKNLQDDSECDDSLYCNGVETCEATGCTSKDAPTCDDSDTCTYDFCNETKKMCESKEIDKDGDGFGVCDATPDCDDNDDDINPDAEERCDNNEDDDCDEKEDEEDPDCFACEDGEERFCDKQEGLCKTAMEECNGTQWNGCDYGLGYEMDEISCEDGIDNDCDGLVDECPEEPEPYICIVDWITGEWSECDKTGFKQRQIYDKNNCSDLTNQPSSIESCTYQGDCFDSVMNGDEKGIDCGGRCDLCPEPKKIGYVIKISADPINGDIFEEYSFNARVENTGDVALKDMTIGTDRTNQNSPHMTLNPFDSASHNFNIVLNDPDMKSIDVRVFVNESLIMSESVAVDITVPEYSLQILPDEEKMAFIIDNRDKGDRDITVEYYIKKDKEYYAFDTKSLKINEDHIYSRIDGFSTKLVEGEYEVGMKVIEDGLDVGNYIGSLSVISGGKAMNVAAIFMVLMVILFIVSGYIFYYAVK